MSINRVYITGNLTREPEQKSTASGTPVLRFGMAVNDRRKSAQTGEWEDYPNFVDVTLFGNRVPYFAERLTKGGKVAVDGRLRYSSWEKDGQKMSRLEVVAEDVELLQAPKAEPAQKTVFDDDIPF